MLTQGLYSCGITFFWSSIGLLCDWCAMVCKEQKLSFLSNQITRNNEKAMESDFVPVVNRRGSAFKRRKRSFKPMKDQFINMEELEGNYDMVLDLMAPETVEEEDYNEKKNEEPWEGGMNTSDCEGSTSE